MRLHLALLLAGLFALSAFTSDAHGGYTFLGIGRASCGRSASDRGAVTDVAHGVWLSGLVRATCDLDDAMLWIQKYYGSGPTDQAIGNLPSGRQRTRAGR